MAWNDQSFSGPGVGSQSPMQQGPVQQGPVSGTPEYGAMVGSGGSGALVNPLHAQAQSGPPVLPVMGTPQPAVQQMQQPMGGAPVMGPSQAPPMTAAQGVPTSRTNDDGQVPVDDLTWINHSRRAIAETRGDPHRQVQLLQHIRAQYLKQRFGRTVRTDEA